MRWEYIYLYYFTHRIHGYSCRHIIPHHHFVRSKWTWSNWIKELELELELDLSNSLIEWMMIVTESLGISISYPIQWMGPIVTKQLINDSANLTQLNCPTLRLASQNKWYENKWMKNCLMMIFNQWMNNIDRNWWCFDFCCAVTTY